LEAEAEHHPPVCTACGTAILRPTRMLLARYLVALLASRELYAHHVDAGSPIALGDPVARIDQHPTDAAILGLHNLSPNAWSGRTREGNVLSIASGRTVRIVDGL